MPLLSFGPEPACVAVARGQPGLGGGFAASPEAAQARALADCGARNQSCRILSPVHCYR